MRRSADQEEIYRELRRRALGEFGEARAEELEEFLRTTARQIAEVEQVVHPPTWNRWSRASIRPA